MSYAASGDLVDRFSEASLLLVAATLADPDVLDTDKVELAIAGADAIIDLHCRGRYALPLSPVPPEILGISCDIARFKLYSDSTKATEAATDAYKAAMAMLVAIRDGKTPLDATLATAADAGASEDTVELVGNDPFFTRCSLKGF